MIILSDYGSIVYIPLIISRMQFLDFTRDSFEHNMENLIINLKNKDFND